MCKSGWAKMCESDLPVGDIPPRDITLAQLLHKGHHFPWPPLVCCTPGKVMPHGTHHIVVKVLTVCQYCLLEQLACHTQTTVAETNRNNSCCFNHFPQIITSQLTMYQVSSAKQVQDLKANKYIKIQDYFIR